MSVNWITSLSGHPGGVVPIAPLQMARNLSVLGLASEHASSVAAIERLDALMAELPHSFVATRILARREALSSSRIEGTSSTLDELLTTEENEGDAPMASDTVLVRSYALTLEKTLIEVRAARAAGFSRELVQRLHRDLMAHDPDYRHEPGALRSSVVWLGGTGHIACSTYNPAPPDAVPGCLDEHIEFLRAEGMEQFLTLPARLAVAHAHFEAIHPFADGNGRVGRMLLALMLSAEGHHPLYLSGYFEAHKQRYYDALKAAQQRLEWTPLLAFTFAAITGSVEEVLATRKALLQLSSAWRSTMVFRRKSAAERALGILPDYPILTVRRLSELLGVSFVAANNAVEQLMATGILAERTGYQRNRLFAAPAVLQIMNRPFGAEPSLSMVL